MSEILTIKQALSDALKEEMDRDQSVLIMGEDIALTGNEGGVFGVTSGFLDRFGPNRVINTPISESAFMGQAVGAAMVGLRPVVEIMFCDFLGVCMDPVINQAAKARFQSGNRRSIPLIIRTTYGAGDGSGAVHSQSLYAMFAGVAGLRVALPSTPQAAYDALKTAFTSADPVLIFEHKGQYERKGIVLKDAPVSKIDRPQAIRHREGSDVTIVAFGAMVHMAIEAAELLHHENISVDIIDPVWISPIDERTLLKSVKKTGRLLVVDEGPGVTGMADMVLSRVVQKCFSDLKAAPASLTPRHTPVPYAPGLEDKWAVTVQMIVEAVRGLMPA